MAPIKFEENIQEKLESRTIAPSDSSWDKLSQRLDEDKTYKKSTHQWWLGIAAGIVLLISAGLFFYDNNAIPSNVQEIVEIDSEEETSKTNIEQIEKSELLQSIPKKIEVVENKTQKSPYDKTVNPVTSNSKLNLQETATIATVAESEKDIIPLTSLISKETIEDIAIEGVIAEITKIKDNNQNVSNIEIDSLLNAAQQEIISKKINKNATRTVDADALLQDVEADLDQSFRTKVFDALKNGYESVKTAVAGRNN